MFLFVVVNICGHASEYIDIANCIDYRTQKYPTGKYEKIFVCSPYRTGSTYIYNIFRFLFEDIETKDNPFWGGAQPIRKVSKNHGLFEKADTIVEIFTIRNPIDSCVSYCRVMKKDVLIDQKFVEDAIDEVMGLWYQFSPLLEEERNCMIFRYEEFVGDIHHVFNDIESFFSIVIDESDKEFLERALSKENVIANTTRYQSFSEYDNITLLHGNHVASETLPIEDYQTIRRIALEKLESHREIIEKWGYSYIFD
jgi:hypothetical protein